MIVLNLKTYEKTLEKAPYFSEVAAEVAEETGVRVIVCPPSPFLAQCIEKNAEVYAQHVDKQMPGAFTGTLPAEALKHLHVKGSLINHSERRVGNLVAIKETVDRLHQNGLESLVCAESAKESVEVAHFAPSFIAVEPPELIGSGISVSNAKPELITNTVKAVRAVNSSVPILCGAGVSNAVDVKNALKLGSDGVLLASAFVNASDPKKFLAELAGAF